MDQESSRARGVERNTGSSILKRSINRKDDAMKAAKPKIKEEPREPIQDRSPEPVVKHAEPKLDAVRDDITKQISDHEKWMNDHTDDARGVQERLQQIAVLQAKLVEMDQPKHETRVRQAQTVQQ